MRAYKRGPKQKKGQEKSEILAKIRRAYHRSRQVGIKTELSITYNNLY